MQKIWQKMRKLLLPILITSGAWMIDSCTACNEQKSEVAIDSMLTIKDTVQLSVKDSTLWGHLGEETSMNVCQFVTDEGDTLYLLRHAGNGEYGNMLGSIGVDNDRYAVTVSTEGEEAYLNVMVNVTQLMGIWKNAEGQLALYADGTAVCQTPNYTQWQMVNGKLVLMGKTSTEYGETDRTDTMTITWLDSDSLKFITPHHIEMVYGK